MSQPDVNLGVVGFGLEADTTPLDRSFAALEKFGKKVDEIGNRTDETAEKLYGRFTQVEKSLTSMYPKIEAVTEAIKRTGADTKHIDNVVQGYERLTQTLRKTGNMANLGQHEINRGVIGMNAIISRSARAAKEQADQNRLATQQADALFRAQQRITDLTDRFKLKGAPDEFSVKATASLQTYQAALSKGTLGTQELRQATRLFTSDVNTLNREFRGYVNTANEAANVQRRISQASRMVGAVNLQAQRFGIPASFRIENQQALGGFQQAMMGNDIRAQIAAQTALANSIHKTREAMLNASSAGVSFAGVFHSLSRATILAAGPLSGFGARMAVMAALFESGSAKAALFIAGTTGIAAVFGILAYGGVKASMEMEKFDALLTSATGSVALAAEEYAYVKSQADLFGQSVKGLVEPYAQFATASRLAGMSLSDQRNVFESILTTGAALRFDTQRTGRAFLALEQMVSKGTVQMQELKLQLGQAIPGAMEIAAIAMGKTTGELIKMMESGDLLAKDLLPKLAETLKTLFSPGALEGAASLQAEIGRLQTAFFEVQKAFDKATESSKVFRSGVIGLRETLEYLTDNMNTVLAVMGAIGGMLVGGLIGTGLVAFARSTMTVVGAVVALWNALSKLSAGFAIFMAAAGGPIAILVRVAAAVVGAIAAFHLLNKETDEQQDAINTFIKKSEQWIATTKEIGYAHKRTAEQMKEDTLSNIRNVEGELELVAAQIGAQRLLQQEHEKTARTKRKGTPQEMMRLRMGLPAKAEDPETKALTDKEKALQATLERLRALYTEISGIKTKDFGLSGKVEKDSKAWESFVDQIRNAVHETEKWDQKIKAIGGPDSKGVIDVAEAFEKADKMMEKLPIKGQKMEQAVEVLKKAGFWVDDLRLSLANMFLHTQNAETEFKEMSETIREQSKAAEGLATEWQKLDAKIKGAEATLAGKDPEDLKRNERQEEFTRKLTAYYNTLGLAQADINSLVDIYVEKWKHLEGVEKEVERVKDLKKELDKLDDAFGSKSDKARRYYIKGIEAVNEAVERGIITEEKAAKMRGSLNNDLYTKLINDGKEWAKKTIEFIHDVEQNASDSIADWATGGETSWRDMLKSMEKDMISFITRMLIMRPIMQGLFGGLATGNYSGEGGGFGLIGNFAMSNFPGLMGALGIGGGAGSVAVEGAGLMDLSAGFSAMDVVPAVVMHGGGNAGIGPVRNVPSSMFRDAPRLHDGGDILGPGEVPIIGKRGEEMLTRDQAEGRTGDVHVHMPVTIVTNDANSFQATKNQWMGDLYSAGADAARRFK